MAVRVVIRETGETVTGKFATVNKDMVSLYAGIAARKHGGYRGCSRKQMFAMSAITLEADNPSVEVERGGGPEA